MKYRSLFVVFVLLVVLSIAACDVVEPAPTLPPPPTSVNNDQPPAIVIEGGTVPAVEGEVPGNGRCEFLADPHSIRQPWPPPATPTEAPEPIIDPAQMPAISHDLLFVGHGKLKRWQRDGNVVTLLADDVVDYSLSRDGRQAVVSQLTASTDISNTVTAVTETIDTYSLTYLNLETSGSQVLVPAVNGSLNAPLVFSLAQDGKHLAFSGLGVNNPETLVFGEEIITELYVVETETGLLPEKIHNCIDRCLGQVWHQDNNFFVFSDRDGLYLYNLAANEPEMLKNGDTGGGV